VDVMQITQLRVSGCNRPGLKHCRRCLDWAICDGCHVWLGGFHQCGVGERSSSGVGFRAAHLPRHRSVRATPLSTTNYRHCANSIQALKQRH